MKVKKLKSQFFKVINRMPYVGGWRYRSGEFVSSVGYLITLVVSVMKIESKIFYKEIQKLCGKGRLYLSLHLH
jgi:hypothetical protein